MMVVKVLISIRLQKTCR